MFLNGSDFRLSISCIFRFIFYLLKQNHVSSSSLCLTEVIGRPLKFRASHIRHNSVGLIFLFSSLPSKSVVLLQVFPSLMTQFPQITLPQSCCEYVISLLKALYSNLDGSYFLKCNSSVSSYILTIIFLNNYKSLLSCPPFTSHPDSKHTNMITCLHMSQTLFV